MRHSEYEQRRRALETQLHDDLALIRAGYQAKLRALEMTWLASSEVESVVRRKEVEEVQAPDEPPAEDETVAVSETETPGETQSESEDPSETQEEVWMVQRSGLRQAVQEALLRLPEVFDKYDLVEALGYEPRRATLIRAINYFLAEKQITIAQYSSGRRATKYRRV